MRAPRGVFGGFVLSLVLAIGQVHGQIKEVGDDGPFRYRRFQAGAHFDVALPQGQFGEFVEAGYGLGGWLAINLDDRGLLAIKLDGDYLIYGRENRRRPLSPTVPFVDVDVTTSNNIYSLGIGPLLTLTDGAVKLFVSGSAGFSYFATESSVSGTSNSTDFAKSTNFDDFTFSWSGGGGMRFRVSNRRNPIYIDVGAEYHRNGEARYLREGSIQDNGNGTITITPIQSETNLLLLKLGVSGAW
jgi:hypothetical protein